MSYCVSRMSVQMNDWFISDHLDSSSVTGPSPVFQYGSNSIFCVTDSVFVGIESLESGHITMWIISTVQSKQYQMIVTFLNCSLIQVIL